MKDMQQLIGDIEILSADGIRDCFNNGIDPNDFYNGRPLIYELIGGYARGSQFRECVQVFVENGLEFDDKILLAVLMDDADSLEDQLVNSPDQLNQTYSLDVAFTQMKEVSLLHICAEFNHINCGRILIKHDLDINTKAGVDEHGFGGQTPVFHAVNQHQNFNLDFLKLLLENKADLQLNVKGLIWGNGYEWETFIPAVNPISYAMMGLLRQFQRKEKDVYEVVSILMEAAYEISYQPANVPNRYLVK